MSEVNSNGCSYVTLSQYNSAAGGCMSSSDCSTNKNHHATMMVPVSGMVGYNTLTVSPTAGPSARADPSCSGFRNITNAYGANAASGSCTKFVQRACN